MAISAIILVGYILVHVIGNLLIFGGPAWINLYHGTWSMARTLGVSRPARAPRPGPAARAFALFVTAGFVAILVAVAVGWLPEHP